MSACAAIPLADLAKLLGQMNLITLTLSFKRNMYRVVHLFGQLGWVDFDFGCSTLCLVLLGLMGSW